MIVGSGKLKSPFLPVILLAVVLVGRWVLVVGLGDFPGDYDIAARLAQGQWQGRDFYMAYTSAISWYNTSLFLRVTNGHYLGVSMAVWLWWMANTLATVWVLRRLDAFAGEQAFGAAGVALLTVPVNTNFVVMNFFSAALATASVVLFLRLLRDSRSLMGLGSGLVAGVAAVAKATAGVGVFGGALGGLMAWWLWGQGTLRQTIRWAGLLIIGFVVGVAIPILVLGFYGGYAEVFTETFLSAQTTKGSPLMWALRTLPRVSLVIGSPYRYAIEAILVLPVIAVLGTIFWRHWRKKVTPVQGAISEQISTTEYLALLWGLFSLVLVLSAWSLIPMPFPHRLDRLTIELHLISFPETLNHLLYVIVYVALGTYILVCLRQSWNMGGPSLRPWNEEKARGLVMVVVGLLAMMAIGAGGRYGSIYAAGVFIPALLVVSRGHGQRKVVPWIALSLAFWTITWHVAPNWPSTFSSLTRLPDGSIFGGMYFPEGGSGKGMHPQWSSSQVIEELYQSMPSRVQGKTVLWMVGGLQGAFGEKIYRPALVPFDPGHPILNEMRVAKAIVERPPEFIVTSGSEADLWDRRPYSDSTSFFWSKRLRPWLLQNYQAVWQTERGRVPLVLWEKIASRRATGPGEPFWFFECESVAAWGFSQEYSGAHLTAGWSKMRKRDSVAR